MARKITMNGQSRKPLNEIFDDFVVSQTAKGLSEVTIATYHRHLRSMSYGGMFSRNGLKLCENLIAKNHK